MTLPALRTRLRRDLHDEDPTNQRWTDAELDRHLLRTVQEVSLAAPREAKAALTAPGGTRTLSIAALTDRVDIEAVEYPMGRYPPSYVAYSLWDQELTLLTETVPAAGEQVLVYYGRSHLVDATSSTLPPALEEIVLLGAAAYAALEWANFAINRVNVGGSESWRAYLAWAQDRLAAYHKALARLSRKNAVRVRRLYSPASVSGGLPGRHTVGPPG
jgi:hypothetical protein